MPGTPSETATSTSLKLLSSSTSDAAPSGHVRPIGVSEISSPMNENT